RYWLWSGGNHFSETPLRPEDAGADWDHVLRRFDGLPVSWISHLNYDRERQVLRCEGVMPQGMQQELVQRAENEGFRSAVYRLAARSHLSPVIDRYGYNASVTRENHRTQDLLLRTVLVWDSPPAEICADLMCANELFRVRLSPRDQTVELVAVDHDRVVAVGSFQESTFRVSDRTAVGDDPQRRTGIELQVSAFDRQVIVAINGSPCFDPYVPESDAAILPTPSPLNERLIADNASTQAANDALLVEQQHRWRLGVSGESVEVAELQMFRDVYYTPGRRRNAIEKPYAIPDGCYFVQGDNSPVSSDSRNWADPCVPQKLLVGKPFLVHLPSRPAILKLGEREILIRIPDWPRIGYIR
ncbi:MAG: hypothetical protein KDA85_19305, partial [Planctomycetaceae bacterium]|nr:hypothetical protein [Planctomycetaceae bacterium]